MGYSFSLKDTHRVKANGIYPWPCDRHPYRTIELVTDDVLTVDPDTGMVMKHTGLGCFGIVVPPEDMEPSGDKNLRIL